MVINAPCSILQTGENLDRVPVPVIAIQGRTLHRCKKRGVDSEVWCPKSLNIFIWGVYKLVRHHEKSIEKPYQFKYYPKIVFFRRARLFNGLLTTPNLNRGCLPALYGDGIGWLRWLARTVTHTMWTHPRRTRDPYCLILWHTTKLILT